MSDTSLFALAALLVVALAAAAPSRQLVGGQLVDGRPLRNTLVCVHTYDPETGECSEEVSAHGCALTDDEGRFEFDVERHSHFCAVARTSNHREATKVFKLDHPNDNRRRSVLDLQLIPVPSLYQDEWEVALHWQDESQADTCNFDLVIRAGDYTTECFSELNNSTLCEEDSFNYVDLSISGSSYSSGDLSYCSGTTASADYEALRIVEEGTRKFDIFVYAHGDSNFDAAASALLAMEIRIAKLKKPDSNGIQFSGTKYTFRLADATFPDIDGRFWHAGTLEVRTDWTVTWGKGSLTSTRNKVKCVPTPATGNTDVIDQIEYGPDGVLDDRRC